MLILGFTLWETLRLLVAGRSSCLPSGFGWRAVRDSLTDNGEDPRPSEREVCHCGTYCDEHTQFDNHAPVAMKDAGAEFEGEPGPFARDLIERGERKFD